VTDSRRSGRPYRRVHAELRAKRLPCHICGKPIDYTLPGSDPQGFVMDHVVPLKHGGHALSLMNVAASHRLCNGKKGTKDVADVVIVPQSRRWCPRTSMHYHRWYRHGSVEAQANRSGVTVSNGRRYVSTYRPGHPLAGKGGKVYVHRATLFDTIGPGPHPCHWCGTELDWLPKGDPAAINVDHLNAIGDDNRPDNLVPSCMSCNTTRGAQARHDALVAAGYWSVNDTIASLSTRQRRPRITHAA
jgi:hypothetical protein